MFLKAYDLHVKTNGFMNVLLDLRRNRFLCSLGTATSCADTQKPESDVYILTKTNAVAICVKVGSVYDGSFERNIAYMRMPKGGKLFFKGICPFIMVFLL